MTELRCIRCAALNVGINQICKVCEFELQPATQLLPGSPIFARPHTSARSHGTSYATVAYIRPFNDVTSVLGPTLKIFFDNFWLITKIVLAIVFPFEVFKTMSYFDLGHDRQLFIGMFVLDGLCHVLIAPALIYALMRVMQTGTAPGVNEAYRWGFGKLGKLAICAAIFWLLKTLGTGLLVIPGIIVIVTFILVYPLAVLEKSSVSEVFLDSKELTRGHRWKIFGAAIVIWLLVNLFALPLEGVGELAMVSDSNLWPILLISSILVDILEQTTTILALVTYLSIRALSSQRTQ